MVTFNPAQFKQKKKRPVDPNAPPRPNLLSHEKKLKENQSLVDDLRLQVKRQADELASLKIKYESMQQSINQILNYLRKGR